MNSPDLSAAVWRKSRRSTDLGGECVEVAVAPTVIAIRDSKNPGGPKLAFDADGWRAFMRRAKAGDHDLT